MKRKTKIRKMPLVKCVACGEWVRLRRDGTGLRAHKYQEGENFGRMLPCPNAVVWGEAHKPPAPAAEPVLGTCEFGDAFCVGSHKQGHGCINWRPLPSEVQPEVKP